MKKNKYIIQYSTSFNKELVEILSYLSNDLNNPKAAKRLIYELENKLKIIICFPKIFPYKIYNDVVMYKFNIQNYSIYYSIQDYTINVNHIFYSKRNLSDLLNSIK